MKVNKRVNEQTDVPQEILLDAFRQCLGGGSLLHEVLVGDLPQEGAMLQLEATLFLWLRTKKRPEEARFSYAIAASEELTAAEREKRRREIYRAIAAATFSPRLRRRSKENLAMSAAVNFGCPRATSILVGGVTLFTEEEKGNAPLILLMWHPVLGKDVVGTAMQKLLLDRD
jgi:hypothetical protein